MSEPILVLQNPELSKWKCVLFGGSEGSGIIWYPVKGDVPNFFWRWMQFICFGNRWKLEE